MRASIKFKGAMVKLKKDLSAAAIKHKNVIISEAIDRLKPATPVDTGEARDGWMTNGSSIENTVEHISQLNEGSSKQAPSLFIEKTLMGIKGVKPNGVIVTYTR